MKENPDDHDWGELSENLTIIVIEWTKAWDPVSFIVFGAGKAHEVPHHHPLRALPFSHVS